MSNRLFLSLFLLFCTKTSAIDDYELGPDSFVQEGVPEGEIIKKFWNESEIFPGTERDWWIYVPAQYDPAEPACVMIYLDGWGRLKPDGKWRSSIVMDNLIHKGQMPITIGIFVNPGRIPEPNENSHFRYNRSVEYDGITELNAAFFFSEIVPQVEAEYNLSKDPNQWGVAGASSGAVGAFMMAWYRPDRVRRVLSSIGTFTNYKAAGSIMTMVRKEEPRPLRVFLQEGSNDKLNYSGSWWMANQELQFFLDWAGYEVAHEWGDGGHNAIHAGSILPKMLTWLWRDWDEPIKTPYSEKQEINKSLLEGESWKLVYEGDLIGGLAGDKEGNVFIGESGRRKILKMDTSGSISDFVEVEGKLKSIACGNKGELFASYSDSRSIEELGSDNSRKKLASGILASDLLPLEDGMYATLPEKRQILYISRSGRISKMDTNIEKPHCISRFIDQMRLSVFQPGNQFGYLYETREEGKLLHEQLFHQLQIWENNTRIGGLDSVYDVLGRLFVATDQGVQIVNHQGRTEGIMIKPDGESPLYLAFGGENLQFLFMASEDRVYRRKMRNPGHWPFDPPTVPEKLLGS